MITKEEFENIANLSRLAIDEAQYAHFCDDLSRMIIFADKIKQAKPSKVQTTCESLKCTALREDVVETSFPSQEILSNAPKSQDGYFLLRKRV